MDGGQESMRGPCGAAGLAVAALVLAFGCEGGGRSATPSGASGGAVSDGGGGSSGADEGGGAGSPSPPGGAPSGGAAGQGFGPVDGLDPGGSARAVGDSFYTVAQIFAAAPDGGSWLLWRSYETPDFTGESIHFEHFDARGAFVRSSVLAENNPDGAALHDDGSLTVLRNRCGPLQADTCFWREEAGGSVTESLWPVSTRTTTRYALDGDGNVVSISEFTAEARFLTAATASGEGLYALTHHGSVVLYRLDESYAPAWSVEVLPGVLPPELPPDAPIEDVLRAADLAHQFTADPVRASNGVVVAATVARGTLAALSESRGVELELPADPRCADVVVVHVSEDGSEVRFFGVPTPECERLPKLAVAGDHAIVASTLRVEKEPEPNDTHQYDIGLAIVDLTNGSVRSRPFALGAEDDMVQAVAPCGPETVCLAGMTGARSVDTGSTVTYGNGFVLPVSLASAELGDVWTLTSPRHTEVRFVAPHPAGLLFFANVNGPITHTADADPWLGYNRGMLGLVEGL